MAAPSIPNLLSLRGARGGGRGRGRGRGGGSAGTGGSTQFGSPSHDATIQGTDTDAAISRLSAVDLGYLQDPFASYFVQSPPIQGPGGGRTYRLPIINRGTYTRTTAIDKLVDRFLRQTDDGQQYRQIISLGAGTDTRSLRLLSSTQPHHRRILYHEIDFPAICQRKLRIVQANPRIRSVLPNATAEEDGSSWHSHAAQQQNSNDDDDSQLWNHGLDLRAIALAQKQQAQDGIKPSSSSPQQPPPPPSTATPPPFSPPTAGTYTPPQINLKSLRFDVPTLLISECCLCYLDPWESRAVVDWFQTRIPDLGMVLYEAVRPEDAFGKMMVSNLRARGIIMPTLSAYPSPQDQERRLVEEAKFSHAFQMTVDRIWEDWVPEQEKERIDTLEGGLDEVEEWQLLAGHYIVAWGWRGGVDLGMETDT